MNKENSTSVTFIREADPPVFLSLPTMLTRPTQRNFLHSRTENNVGAQPSNVEVGSGSGNALSGDETPGAVVVARNAPDTTL